MKKQLILALMSFFMMTWVITADATVWTPKGDKPMHTWLPVKSSSERVTTDAGTSSVNNFVKNLKGSIRPIVC